MPEPQDNSVSVRISAKLLNKLKDEQYAQRKRGEPESTYSELLELSWNSRESTQSGNTTKNHKFSVKSPGSMKYNNIHIVEAARKSLQAVEAAAEAIGELALALATGE